MLRTTTALVLLPLAASAEAPVVITDIAPVHSLVARVMEGAGTPDLLLPPSASPHDFALRPSDAQRLSEADLVVWVGEKLSPMLEGPIEDLAGEAEHLELLATEGWPKRMFDAERDHDDHDHDAHDHDDHEHEHEHEHGDHDDHDHGEHEHDHDAHDEHEHGDHDDHDAHAGHNHHHEGLDPHAWLDPVVAQAWTVTIAETLGRIDPENAALYAANAEAAQAELADLRARIEARLSGVSGSFVVPHDAYGYFTDRFGLPAAGEIALHDAQAPGPARIAELKARIADEHIACILTDPQVSSNWTDLLREGTDAHTARVDPIGGDFAPGPDHYAQTLTALAEGIASCLEG